LSFDLVFHRLRSAPDLPETDLALLRPGTPPDNASQ
jgi:hypothetical protein